MNKSRFPSPSQARPDGLLAVGGELSPDFLLDAYTHGIFPWFDEQSPVLWWSPPTRPLLYPANIHVSKRLWRQIKHFRVSLNHDFQSVISVCAHIKRPEQDGSWITGEMITAYSRLHDLGLAHSIEVWEEDSLAGGLYGVSIGRAFFGESMFHRNSNASKAGLIALCRLLAHLRFPFLDCQQMTPHIARFGAVEVSRDTFLRQLKNAVSLPQPDWKKAQAYFTDFCFRLAAPNSSAEKN